MSTGEIRIKEIYNISKKLVIFSKGNIAKLTGLTEANAYKYLKSLSDTGKLIRGRGYFKLPGCKSEWKGHSQLITSSLVAILSVFPESRISREKFIPEISLIPDSICLVVHEGQGRCFILEVCRHETLQYLSAKVNKWKHWDRSTEFLTDLFKVEIPSFDIVVDGDIDIDLPKFDEYLKSLTKGGENR